MKLMFRAELLQQPRGTLYYTVARDGHNIGELHRFEGPLRGDFLCSWVGVHVWDEGFWVKERPFVHATIDSDSGREGLFDENQVYLVLEPHDVAAIIKQLQGGDVETSDGHVLDLTPVQP